MLLSTLCWVSLPQEILSGDQTEAVCQSAGPISSTETKGPSEMFMELHIEEKREEGDRGD